MHSIRVEKFEGPLELLLELIEKEKLDITLVSLSQVTEQYLDALEGLNETRPDELADFLVVASKLLLIKSRVLLPDLLPLDEEAEDLAIQLKMYKEYYDASKVIHKMLLKKHFSFPRTKPAVTITTVFNPPKSLTAAKLKDLFLTVLREIEPIIALPKEVIRRSVSLHEKISSIRTLLEQTSSVRFSGLVEKAQSRMDIIVTFLALLELVKQRTIVVTQDSMFEEIVVETTETII